MCTGAILQARMRTAWYLVVSIAKAGAVESLYRLCEDQRLNHQLPVTRRRACRSDRAAMLADFLQASAAAKTSNTKKRRGGRARLKALDSKSSVRGTVPGVRIPPSPPNFLPACTGGPILSGNKSQDVCVVRTRARRSNFPSLIAKGVESESNKRKMAVLQTGKVRSKKCFTGTTFGRASTRRRCRQISLL